MHLNSSLGAVYPKFQSILNRSHSDGSEKV